MTMSKKGTIDGLSPELRSLVIRKLYERGFKDYSALAEEMKAEGITTSKSAVHRYAQKIESSFRQEELVQIMKMIGEGEGGQVDALAGFRRKAL